MAGVEPALFSAGFCDQRVYYTINNKARYFRIRLCTHQQEYLQHLEAFLRLIEPIIEDLKAKGFIK